MITDTDLTKLRAIRRSATVFLLVHRLDKPVTAREIADYLLIDYETVRQCLHDLANPPLQLITRIRQKRWMLTAGGRQLIFPMEANAEKPRLPSTTTTITIKDIEESSNRREESRQANAEKPRLPQMSEQANAEKPRLLDNLTTLQEYGITANNRTRELAAQDHINPQYIRAHANQLIASGKPLPKHAGLLITILESGAAAPPTRSNGHLKSCKCSDCQNIEYKGWVT